MQPPQDRPADEPDSDAGTTSSSTKVNPLVKTTRDLVAYGTAQAGHWPWLFSLLLIAATLLAYLPALRGGLVWDDDSWTTNLYGLLQNTSGLHLIWFQPTAMQQYYPLTGTTFWLDYQLWKFWTTPYHVENVLLHSLAALLFWRLLLRLQIPGAWLAAALFALHPVMVESAAWITERKNVLSLVLYLAAFLAYLRWAEKSTVHSPQSKVVYGWALLLFAGALLAKTTAFSLPAAILLVIWWQRGCLLWRRDVLPTLPFFALAIGLCAVTFWLEKTHVGAQGSDFELSFSQRCLVAGRVFWFYPAKLLWPAHLCFVYPRWQPDTGVWWQWLYPIGAVGGLAALWLARGRIGRGPITALFFYVGTLFPVLGFMNAYFMRFSFVCDHWVYLSSLGIIALGAALVVRAAERLRTPAMVYGFAVIVLPVLGLLTWRQAGMYTNMETLWRTALDRNPDCWMAQNNLGAWYFARRRPAEAETLYRDALRLNPGYAEAHSNLGTALAAQGKLAEAMEHFNQALDLKPGYAEGHYNIGVALASQGKWAEAMQHYERALQIKPDYAEALYNLGTMLASRGKLTEAIQLFERALRIKPDYAEAHSNLATALAVQGKPAEAIQHFERVLQLKPDFAGAHFNLGLTLAAQGKSTEAMQHYQQALSLATAQGNTPLAQAIRARIAAYPPPSPHPQTP